VTLPFTDLTINPWVSQYRSHHPNYDSSTGSNDTGLGYGWTLNVTGTDLRSTVPPQTGIPKRPAIRMVTCCMSPRPNGVQQPLNSSQTNQQLCGQPLAGLIGQVEQYTPQFLCVDGSGAKLILANSSGADASGNFTLYQDGGVTSTTAAQVRTGSIRSTSPDCTTF